MTEDIKDFSCAFKALDDFIDSLPETEGKLITVLHEAQNLIGYLPQEVQRHIAQRLGIKPAKVYGVVTFYSFFNTDQKGKYQVSVCMGTACFVRGADVILEEFKKKLEIGVGETTPDGMFSLDAVRCIGACGLAPVITVNEKIYGRLKAEDVGAILDEYK
jgi:NADH-quinone oxidoreductase E subunit